MDPSACFVFVFDEGVPRVRAESRKTFSSRAFLSFFVLRSARNAHERGRVMDSRGAVSFLQKTRGMRGLFACRVFAFGGHETYVGIQSRETHNPRNSVSNAAFRADRDRASRYTFLVSFFAKSRRPFLESRTVVFLDGSGVTNSTTRKCFWRMFWRAGSPRRASFYPTHAHARRRYVHARERSAYESLLSPTRVRRTSR